MLLWIITIFFALLAFWALWLREWLKNQPWPWSQALFAAIEPTERWLWDKSETILFARLKILLGVVLTMLTQAGTVDITPLMPFVPDEYEGFLKTMWSFLPLAITIIGFMDERLRRTTTKPMEIVSLPTNLPPEVEEKLEAAQVARTEVLASIKEAKAEGKV